MRLVSPTRLFKGMGAYTMGNPVVFIEKLPGINLLCPTTGNNMNNPLGAVLVPSIVNVFYTYAPQSEVIPKDADAGAQAPLSLEALRELAAAVSPEPSAKEVPSQPEKAVEGRWLDEGVMFLRIARVPSQVSRLVFNEVERLGAEAPQQTIDAMVIDLRGNRGGDAESAMRLADDFLDRGTVMAIRRDASGDDTVLTARHSDPYAWPLTILIDHTTASAAEVFTAALQHNGRAKVAGDSRSYGKGSAQQPQVASHGKGHYATVASYLRPNGEPIEGAGVTPDMALSALPSSIAQASLAPISNRPS